MKKKFLLLALLLIAAFALGACAREDDDEVTPAGNGQATEQETTPADTGRATVMPAGDIQIALIAHSPDSILDDGSFNAGAWDGIADFLTSQGLSTERGVHRQFYQPHTASDTARIDLIEDAINAGANVLVLPGFHFISSLYIAQDMFPDTTFILLDAVPAGDDGPRVANNLVAIEYAEEQSGFLAGYAAVRNGYRELGFMGGAAVPAVVRFGHGFIQGAEHAANALDLAQGDVTINYYYLGRFAPDPAVVTQAGAWFAAGTEVIFAAAGGAGGSVIAAAEAADASVIGVDVDQSGDSNVVVTSAVKGLAVSVNDMLTAFLYDEFPGGQVLMFDAAINGIGLPMASSRLANFSQAQYDAIFAQLANGTIYVNASLYMDDIATSLVVVNN